MDLLFPVARPSLTELEQRYVNDAVRTGWVSSLGSYIQRFEEEFAEFCSVKHAVSVCNGTAALHLALKALCVGPGDEVIVPDLSFIATANAVLLSGAQPVFVDIDPDTLCLDPRMLDRALTVRTRAIMPVHLYGHPAAMPAINRFAREHGLHVIEDAAEAHGAMVEGRPVGGLGSCAAFSFYGNKTLTTGEGGMITTNDDALAERCRFLRDHGMSSERRYWHTEAAFNYRLTNIQAALGCAQLERAPELLAARRRIMRWYREHLGGVERITLNRRASWASPSCWMVCAEFADFKESDRTLLMRRLRERGVDSRPYFYPMSDMPYLSPARTPVAHAVYRTGINLPTYIELTEEDVVQIGRAVRDELASIRR